MNEQNNNEVDIQEKVLDRVVTDEELSSSDEERVQDADSSTLDESQAVFDATNQIDDVDDTNFEHAYENQSEGTNKSPIEDESKERSDIDESKEISDNGNDIQQEANNHKTIAARQQETQYKQTYAKDMASQDELRDKLREGLRDKVQE